MRRPWYVAPLLALYRLAGDARALVDADVERWLWVGREEGWGWVGALGEPDAPGRLAAVLAHSSDYRPLFYHRLRRAGMSGLLVALAERIFPGPPAVHLDTAEIGTGLYLPHGYGTVLVAERIGRNCRIHQLVTVGWNGTGNKPTIGDDVTIFTGAVVIGDITIGDGAVIGANAVVVRDVAPGQVVGGIPARPLH